MQVVVEEGLSGEDRRAVFHLQQFWLHAPSTLPYNLNGSPSYLSSVRGDTWIFVHHYVTRLFAGKAKVVVVVIYLFFVQVVLLSCFGYDQRLVLSVLT